MEKFTISASDSNRYKSKQRMMALMMIPLTKPTTIVNRIMKSWLKHSRIVLLL